MPIKCWKCCVCDKTYTDIKKAISCENSHRKKLNEKQNILLTCFQTNKKICDFCNNAYYSYGCEFDCINIDKCKISNDYKYFEIKV